jgi:uncharacterized integral membrane protein
MTRRERRLEWGGVFVGAILLLVGGYYVLTNTLGYDLGPLNWDALWPLIIVGLGALFIIGALRNRDSGETPGP